MLDPLVAQEKKWHGQQPVSFNYYLFMHKRDEQALETFPGNPTSRRDGHVVAIGKTDHSDMGGFRHPETRT